MSYKGFNGRNSARAGWLRLFALICCTLALLTLSSERPRQANSQAADPCDLCTVLPSGAERIYGSSKESECEGAYKEGYVTISRTWTDEVAREWVLQFKNYPNAREAAYGELAYEFPEGPGDADIYQLNFKRGSLLVTVKGILNLGGARPDHSANAVKMQERARQVDASLGGILGVCPGFSASGPAPTNTSVPAVLPTDTSVPPTETPTPDPPPAQLDLTIDHIEVVQVVQDEYNRVQLYSGRRTLVRVFVAVNGATGPVPDVEVELRAFGWHDDTGQVILARNSPFTAPPSPSRDNLADTVNFDLSDPLLDPTEDPLVAPSTYPIKVTVNPNRTVAETDYSNNDLTQQVTFVEPDLLRIGYVRVGYTPPGAANVAWPAGPIDTYDELLRQIYPIDSDHLRYYELPFRLMSTRPINTTVQQVDLRNRLRRRYDRMRSGIGEMAPDLVVGWLAWPAAGQPNVFTRFAGLAEGIGSHTFTPRVAWLVDYNGAGGPDSSERLLAHEVGHLLTLHHPGTTDGAPCWAVAPNTFPNYWEFGTGTTHEIGYDDTTGNLVPDTFYDIMNYCPANMTWISRLHYRRLAEGMRRHNANDPDLMPDPTLDAALVSGSLARDGSAGQLDPIYKVAGAGQSRALQVVPVQLGAKVAASNRSAQQQEGENCLQFTGASGIISEHCFDVSFEIEETGEVLDEAGFSVRVPYPRGATGVTLLRLGNQLDERTASSNAPTLSITSPASGETWDGNQSISWTASDDDGDSLIYEVHYSPNGGSDWFPLELDLEDTQYEIDTTEIAGGSNVTFRVLASDGFNTTQADVGPIEIPNSPAFAPPPNPVSRSGQNQPTLPASQSGSGPNLLLLGLLGLGVAVIVGVGLIVIVAIVFYRSRQRRRRRMLSESYDPYDPYNSYDPPQW